jgi:hypothetical protein
MVKRTCSEPGVIVNSDFNLNFSTCFAKLSARLISSYEEELVQLPIKPTSIF